MSAARDFSTRGRSTRQPLLSRILFGAAVLALAFTAWSAGRAYADYREARRSVDEVRSERDALRGRLAALSPGAPDRGAPPVLVRAALTLDAPPPRIVAALARTLPPGVRIDMLDVRYGREIRVHLAVTARDAASYDTFLRRLESAAAFRGVLPGAETRGAGVKATVTATFAGSGR